MKLSSKEMIILAIFLSIAIIAVGFFLFIKPEYDKIEPNRNSLNAAKDERDQLYASLNREATIDQEIQDAIDQANTFSLYFYDDMTNYEADAVIREILEATNMHTSSLSLGGFSTAILSVSDYISSTVSYPLQEYSGFKVNNINGSDYPLEYDEEGNIVVPDVYLERYGEEQALTEYLTALLSTQTQTVGAITANFTVSGTRGDFLNFLNYVANLDRATYISSTSVAYTGASISSSGSSSSTNTESPSTESGEGESSEEGEEDKSTDAPVTTPAPSNTTGGQLLNDNAEISAPITMTLYCVKPMLPQETTEAETEAEPEPAA